MVMRMNRRGNIHALSGIRTYGLTGRVQAIKAYASVHTATGTGAAIYSDATKLI
jgi:hypothetical protein